MPPDAKSIRERIAREAAEWVVREAGAPLTPDERARLRAWLGEDPAHEVAYERESLAWERTERLRALRPADPAAFHKLSDWSRKPRGLGVRPWRLAAASLLFVGAASIAVLVLGGQSKAYATAVGERRVVVLDDGSRIELNTDTRVVVRMTRMGRQVKLVKGEALFQVSPDRRPFVVAAQGEEVRGSSGAFNVRLAENDVRVFVVAGKIEVSGKAGPTNASFDVNLATGGTGAYGLRGATTGALAKGEADRLLSWRYGTIALSGQTLREAAAEFNRYNAKRLVIADPSIAELKLGGYFRNNDVEGFARALQTSFDVQAVDNGATISLSRAPTSSHATGA